MLKQTINKVAIAVATLSLAAMPVMALAQAPSVGGSSGTTVTTEDLLPSDLAGNLGQSNSDIRTTVARVIRAFMGLLGLVAVCIILLGGFKWMTAGGADEKVGEAKQLIISGVIGLVIILSAYGIANFVINAIVTGQKG